jgi:hypothetical protein
MKKSSKKSSKKNIYDILLIEVYFLAIAMFVQYKHDIIAFLGVCKDTAGFAIEYYKRHIPRELRQRQMFATPGVTAHQAWRGEFVLWLLLRQLPEELSLAIAGSFALHTYMRANNIPSEKPWHPTDVDMYFTGDLNWSPKTYLEQVMQHVEEYMQLVKQNLGITLRYKKKKWKPYYISTTLVTFSGRPPTKQTFLVVDICLPPVLTNLGMTCLSFIARPVLNKYLNCWTRCPPGWAQTGGSPGSLLRHVLKWFDITACQVGLIVKRRENDTILQFVLSSSTETAIRNQQLIVIRAGHPRTPSRLIKYLHRGFTVTGKIGTNMYENLHT